MNPLIAMTVSFASGTIASWTMNRRWTFGDLDTDRWSAIRFFTCYGVMYAVNWLGLYSLVKELGWNHQFAQGFLVIAIASLNFILLKLWVFPKRLD